MKAINTEAVITSIRSRRDKSLGLSMETPELTSSEKAEFMNLQGINLDVFFNPKDEPGAPELKIDKEVSTKTQSQRLRAVLFVLWKQEGEKDKFEDFYRDRMEKFIDWIKEKLDK